MHHVFSRETVVMANVSAQFGGCENCFLYFVNAVKENYTCAHAKYDRALISDFLKENQKKIPLEIFDDANFLLGYHCQVCPGCKAKEVS